MSLARLRDLLVLGAVRAHPAHGYALAEHLEAGLGWTLGLTRPTLYASLNRMEERGWLVAEEQREGGAPPRRVVHVTDAGEAAYRSLLERCAREGAASMVPLAGLIAHLDDLPEALRGPAVQEMRARRLEQLQALEALPKHGGAGGVALRLSRDQLRLELDALDQLGGGS